ncbi:bifunctional riboflavin kinase/FAD synthetase [Paenibacillus foliorum]|nr:bifunctional riboflavin kinase/FAD synthetase [Paenibacillus foliorum]
MGPQVLAIGDFDGVHLGHQEVIKRAIHTAEGLRIPASIMTFHPHPRQVLGQCKYVQLLTPVEQKKRLMEALGVDNMYIVSFNNELMKVSPSEFVENMLVPMKVNTVIVGFDFTFGHLGAGTPDTLCELAQGRFAVEVIRPFHQNGSKVSSTWVREHLLSGNLEQANALLGRPYSLNGIVVHGDGRGKTIGFPTANIDLLDPFLIPTLGVYAARVTVDGQTYNSVMNVGNKPTFESNLEKPTLEAHLFDFSESIYGKEVTVDFISYLRPERKFSGVTELIAQIQRDADQAKLLLA